MLVKTEINEAYQEAFISVNAQKDSVELHVLADAIREFVNEQNLAGSDRGAQKIIPIYQIIRVHTLGKHVVCETISGTFQVKERIYELRHLLSERLFLQISSSEIVNISQIANFSLTKNGIYQVNFKNGKITYASRRYMQKIKKEYFS
ncbi:LytTR family DNA-binding domain-containing protein [Xylocopilactobacillus apis]|uniref:Transcriptional regulator n=1 Tax=Xylocopilactobacillus apis TaxID=2932183 RepID=A0AAU9D1I5_9LACO|nr:LytTR family DNA-binding domain-containing protein [Xylocopilactobacillus apis]BDR57388.1 transcriptional regulator [Xylocopilactobacillus apis]